MTVKQIKESIKEDKKVFWTNNLYYIHLDKDGNLVIKNNMNPFQSLLTDKELENCFTV